MRKMCRCLGVGYKRALVGKPQVTKLSYGLGSKNQIDPFGFDPIQLEPDIQSLWIGYTWIGYLILKTLEDENRNLLFFFPLGIMAHFSVGGHHQLQVVNPENNETSSSDEHECVPLKQRLKLLRAKSLSKTPNEILVNKEDDGESLGFHSDHEGSKGRSNVIVSCEQSPHGTIHDDIEISEDFFEDLDNVVLKERQRMLLSRELVRSVEPAMESLSDPSTNSVDMISQNAGIGSGGSGICDIGGNDTFEKSDGSVYASCEAMESRSLNGINADASPRTYPHQRATLSKSRKYKHVHGESGPCISSRSTKNEHCFSSSSCKTVRTLALPPFPNVKVEPVDDELQISDKDSLDSRSLGTQISVKSEHVNTAEIYEDIVDHMLLGDRMRLLASRKFPKTTLNENFENLSTFVSSGNDHKPTLLESRLPLVKKRPHKRKKTVTDSIETALEEDAPGLLQVLIEKGVLVDEIKLYGEPEGDDGLDESLIEESFSELEDVIAKNTDACMWLVFHKNNGKNFPVGILFLSAIKVYDNFGEFDENSMPSWKSLHPQPDFCNNAVKLKHLTQIFSHRQSFFKLAPVRCAKGEKASYCLACLISLVEQARYLRVRKWPVEWGWCRDLQSFIFVFERQNRIVLERPEYGYATYFFELVDTLPVRWQIRRLVTAMKLTSCSRITLIENRALTVGDDLTEGEARVLMEYGWIPDSGLGTMLNYCDRVVHDRKHESDTSEWRSKIGKLLTDGYNGGTIVPNDIPKKVMESGFGYTAEIKLEE
ncbi:hypothetical protein OSB04_000658 [Centaurea solstitialis]|uniref:Uncharacterized protein n=1 Tax=Centaurea solstitialis TaxID=347529 RepID=A0AA38WKR1_9ASTR|nr:hypothetical protein OSB04_000658 [Centaurea solstitialis]